MLWDVPGYYGMFQGCSGVVPSCSGGVPGVFRGCFGVFRECSGVFRECSGVFRGVPGCSGAVPGFTDTPSARAQRLRLLFTEKFKSREKLFFSQDSYREIVQHKMITETLTYNFVQTKIIIETLRPLSALVLFNRESNKSRP